MSAASARRSAVELTLIQQPCRSQWAFRRSPPFCNGSNPAVAVNGRSRPKLRTGGATHASRNEAAPVWSVSRTVEGIFLC